MENHNKWMQIAIKQAILAREKGEVPVGAVLIKDGILIAKSYNKSILKNDATAHAEIEVIRKAGNKLDNYRLVNTELYVTLEPCMMCLSALLHARISKIFFGAYDFKAGACGSCEDFKSLNCFNHEANIHGGILERDCKNLLQDFFKTRRKKNTYKQ
jgi:tRNA(adenine34) deaminase